VEIRERVRCFSPLAWHRSRKSATVRTGKFAVLGVRLSQVVGLARKHSTNSAHPPDCERLPLVKRQLAGLFLPAKFFVRPKHFRQDTALGSFWKRKVITEGIAGTALCPRRKRTVTATAELLGRCRCSAFHLSGLFEIESQNRGYRKCSWISRAVRDLHMRQEGTSAIRSVTLDCAARSPSTGSDPSKTQT